MTATISTEKGGDCNILLNGWQKGRAITLRHLFKLPYDFLVYFSNQIEITEFPDMAVVSSEPVSVYLSNM